MKALVSVPIIRSTDRQSPVSMPLTLSMPSYNPDQVLNVLINVGHQVSMTTTWEPVEQVDWSIGSFDYNI